MSPSPFWYLNWEALAKKKKKSLIQEEFSDGLEFHDFDLVILINERKPETGRLIQPMMHHINQK